MSETTNKIQKAAQAQAAKEPAVIAEKASVNQLMASLLDSNKMRARFDELLGKRAPQFISSVVAMVNGSPELQKAFYENPMSVIQSALTAATHDLPVGDGLGYAYILPFKESKKRSDGTYEQKMSATYVIGWKGMHQLAMRTGSYRLINVTDVRSGELKSRNRLTGEVKFDFVEDDDARAELAVIGYAGHFEMINGFEKTVYMSIEEIRRHEEANRKGKYMTKGWRENFDSMARKTVYRNLVGKWGAMSIEYQSRGAGQMIADQVAAEDAIGIAAGTDVFDGFDAEYEVNEEAQGSEPVTNA